jgi:MarR family transcriptional regulator for hemolysin
MFMQKRDCPPEALVGFWINRASRGLVRMLDARLRPLGLAMTHFPVLRALGERGELSQGELARIAHVEQPTMAMLLMRMERDGLIERRSHPSDKRASLTKLTPQARNRVQKASKTLVDAEREVMQALTAKERVQLLSLLQRVVNAIEA